MTYNQLIWKTTDPDVTVDRVFYTHTHMKVSDPFFLILYEDENRANFEAYITRSVIRR